MSELWLHVKWISIPEKAWNSESEYVCVYFKTVFQWYSVEKLQEHPKTTSSLEVLF